jgi:hypothetical protein
MERDRGGVAVVWYPDLGLREWLVDEVAGLADSDAAPLRTSDVEEAIRNPQRMALLLPSLSDEEAVVDDLEGCRDRLLADPARSQPVILFLLRDGSGRDALARAPSLSSWVRGSDADPEQLAEVDVAVERARFETETGKTVEDWLATWRAEQIPRNGETFTRAYWAALLEQR